MQEYVIGCVNQVGNILCLTINGTSASLLDAATSIGAKCGPFANVTGNAVYNNLVDMGGMTVRIAAPLVNALNIAPTMASLTQCAHDKLGAITDPQMMASGFAKGFGAGAGTIVGLAAVAGLTFFAVKKACGKKPGELVRLTEAAVDELSSYQSGAQL